MHNVAQHFFAMLCDPLVWIDLRQQWPEPGCQQTSFKRSHDRSKQRLLSLTADDPREVMQGMEYNL